MRADHLKQLLKNGVYRTLGEAATGVGVANGVDGRALRVLMYHKINDEPENSVTVPVSLFDEQLAQLGELGYTAVTLDDVLAYYVDGVPLPDGAVLITFDDGYRDNLENAVPVLEKYGYPAVLFVPIGYLDGSRPLPHDRRAARPAWSSGCRDTAARGTSDLLGRWRVRQAPRGPGIPRCSCGRTGTGLDLRHAAASCGRRVVRHRRTRRDTRVEPGRHRAICG